MLGMTSSRSELALAIVKLYGCVRERLSDYFN